MKKVKLGDVLDIKRGTSLSGKYYSTKGDKIRLTLGNFDYPNGGFKQNTSKDNIYYVGPDVKNEFILKKGDIITPLTEQVAGLLGETAKIPESNKYILCGDTALVIPDEKKLDNNYAYYLLSSPLIKRQLGAAAQQTKIRHTSPDKIKSCIAWLPEIEYQRKAGELLSNIDKKIENNNAISSQLESLAKTVYDYWFLQFDFPDENGNPYRSSGGKMVWNDELKREIPEGWEVKRIIDIEDNIITGKTPSTENMRNYGKDIPFICIGDIRNHPFVVSTNIKLSKSGADSQKKKYIPAESLCVTCIASPGLVGFTTEISQTNQQINSISFSKEYNKPFMYFAIKSYFENSSGAKTGNTFANMNKKDFSSIQLLYNEETVRKYYCFVNNVFSEIKNIELENQQLASLRDFLLPLLMNGQVTIE